MNCVNECVFVLAIVNVLRPWFLFRASSLSVKTYATLVRNTTPHPSANGISSLMSLG